MRYRGHLRNRMLGLQRDSPCRRRTMPGQKLCTGKRPLGMEMGTSNQIVSFLALMFIFQGASTDIHTPGIERRFKPKQKFAMMIPPMSNSITCSRGGRMNKHNAVGPRFSCPVHCQDLSWRLVAVRIVETPMPNTPQLLLIEFGKSLKHQKHSYVRTHGLTYIAIRTAKPPPSSRSQIVLYR